MKTWSLMLLPALLFGCGREKKKSETLIMANEAHLDAMQIAHELEETIDSLRRYRPDAAQQSKLDSIADLITLWEESVVEVPGFAHEHDHAHGHEHKPAPQMTDESMLEYQLNAKQAIDAIRIELDSQLTEEK
jgi:hypothetical protein